MESLLMKMLSFNKISSLDNLLFNNGYKNIAIYGGGVVGALLYETLQNSKVEVKLLIDKNENPSEKFKIPSIRPLYAKEKIESYIDCVIVAMADTFECDRVVLNFSKQVSTPVIPAWQLFFSEQDFLQYEKAIFLCKEKNVPIFMFDMYNSIARIKKPSALENFKLSLGKNVLPRDSLDFIAMFDDLENVSQNYIYDILKFTLPPIIHFRDCAKGVRCIADVCNSYVSVIDGIRKTTDTPLQPQSYIYCFGHCNIFGTAAEDKNTTASQLQRILNSKCNQKYCVKNYGWFYTENNEVSFETISNLPLKNTDIIMVITRTNSYKLLNYRLDENVRDYVTFLDIAPAFDRPHSYESEIFFDGRMHMNHRGYRLMAEYIFNQIMK